jgi:Cu+-exporting ATPase
MSLNNLQIADRQPETEPAAVCYHCGLPCNDETIVLKDKSFCCQGCKLVYEILNENDLCQYYALNDTPGAKPNVPELPERFAYLDDESIQQQLIDFRNEKLTKVTFYIPAIRCSSCLWLLENLHRINGGILSAKVNFLRKEISVMIDHKVISLKALVILLASIGYEPLITLKGNRYTEQLQQQNRSLYKKLGIAGFSFGNIMLLSFPEYLDFGKTLSQEFRQFFGYMNILLALPILFYSAADYFRSAWSSLRFKTVNIDVPISLGIAAMFGRSLVEILGGYGAGYMDSFAGLVFFLLIGKLFQQKTFDNLSFERDYKSFFPISVTRRENNGEKSIPLAKLKVGDRIKVRHNELIPADSILLSGNGMIDYSFVTGESEPVEKQIGELIYAGGRQVGSAIELTVVKEVSQSYLTQLWNNDIFNNQNDRGLNSFVNSVSKYFTLAILTIATLGATYWYTISGFSQAISIFTAVLIIACPCALALSAPFTLGNVLRIFGRNHFYLKNTSIVEQLSKITHIVFDKTGTITQPRKSEVQFISLNGSATLSKDHKRIIKSLVQQSTHPLSYNIFNALEGNADALVTSFQELPGAGISATVDGKSVKLGSANFVGCHHIGNQAAASGVYVSIDNQPKGLFIIKNHYRPGLSGLLNQLKSHYEISLISGDNDREQAALREYFGNSTQMLFNQSPQQKLEYIKKLQKNGAKILMIGDGLNDAGALKQSNVGIAISDDLNSFSPACDAILNGSALHQLADYLRFAQIGMRVIYSNFGISLLYNTIGLGFALSGVLSPLVCAILMPLSSISVIIIAGGATTILARSTGLWQANAIKGDS